MRWRWLVALAETIKDDGAACRVRSHRETLIAEIRKRPTMWTAAEVVYLSRQAE